MGETKFTEAPWQSQHDNDMDGICRIIGAIDGPDDGRFHYRVVCEVDPDGSLDAKEQYANARLIAAAPTQNEEMRRYLPILERAEADPEIWTRLTEGTGIATLNGYRSALLLANTGGTENG